MARYLRSTSGGRIFYFYFLLVLGLVSPAEAQSSGDPFFDLMLKQAIGAPTIGDLVAKAADDAIHGAVIKSTLTAEIGAARERFWRNYPNGPDLTAAKQDFDRLLFSKDEAYLMLFLPQGRPDPTISALQAITGGEIDGGIPQGAQPAYRAWVEDIRTRLGARPGEQLPLAAYVRLKDAVNASGPVYRDYLLRREQEEFRLRGMVPPSADPIVWKTITLFVETRPWEAKGGDYANLSHSASLGVDPYKQAQKLYVEIEDILGADHVREVARRVFGLSAKGKVPAPADYGGYTEPDLLQALGDHLGSGDAKRFLIGQLRKSVSVERQWDWRSAESYYKVLVKQGGEDTVLRIAEQMRIAPKTTQVQTIIADGIIYNLLAEPIPFGCRIPRVRYCMEEVLKRGN